VSDENVPPAGSEAPRPPAAVGQVETRPENVQNKSTWTLPPGSLCGGGALASLGAATYTGHVPIGVAATVSVAIAILMLMTTLIRNVMPQKSEHRKDTILATLDHRRKMTVLKTKARADRGATVELANGVIPLPRTASNPSPPQRRRRLGNRTR
jgi:hypothetical protein